MRRFRREIAIGLAAFLAVGALMAYVLAGRFFAPMWPTEDEVVRSVATDATVFDSTTAEQLVGVTLERRRTIVLRPTIVNGAGEVLVSTSTTTEAGEIVSRQRWTGLKDDLTGEALSSPINSEKVTRLNGSGDAVEVSQPLPQMKGQLVRFPRHTPARDFLRWDPETDTASDAVFQRKASVDGRKVLVFRQQATMREGQRSTRSETTLWVRPEVGAVVRSSTHVTTRLGGGADSTVVLDATFVDDPRDVRAVSKQVDGLVDEYRWQRTYGPAAALLVSVAAAVLALLDGSRRRSKRTSVTP